MNVGDVFDSARNPHYKEHSDPVIYCITNRLNGKIYVGSAMNFNHRFYSYKTVKNPKSTRAIDLAIKKYGFEHFEFKILEVIVGNKADKAKFKTTILAREQFWIDELQAFEKKIGYNISRKAGSCLGVKATSKARENMRRAVLGRIESLRSQRSKAVLKIDVETLSVIKEFASGKEAARSEGGGLSIYHACNRKMTTAYGFYWCYKSDYDSKQFVPRKSEKKNNCYLNVKPIYQLSLAGDILRTWNSISDINRELRYDFGLIGKCCRGEKSSYNGFKWAWVQDPKLIEQIRSEVKTSVYLN